MSVLLAAAVVLPHKQLCSGDQAFHSLVPLQVRLMSAMRVQIITMWRNAACSTTVLELGGALASSAPDAAAGAFGPSFRALGSGF
jgi:hypothetical protein